MRTVVANAMLCLLILLTVGSVRCEVRCTSTSMLTSPTAQTGATKVMEHCGGMLSSHDDAFLMNASCSSGMCSHQALSAASDYSLDPASHIDLQMADLRWNAASVSLPLRGVRLEVARPPLLLRSPLEQSSNFRV